MPTANLPGDLVMYYEGKLVKIPGASGYVQHSAPEQCAAIWRDWVRSLR